MMFDHSNQTFVGWQKQGMLRAAMGFAYDPRLEAWRPGRVATPTAPAPFPTQEGSRQSPDPGMPPRERPRRYTFDLMISRVKGVKDPTTIFDLLPDLFGIVDINSVSKETRWGLWAQMTNAAIKVLGPKSSNVEDRYWTYAAQIVAHNTDNVPSDLSDAEKRDSVRAFLEGVILIEREWAPKS
jgi:hypothetical protein